MRDLLNGFAVTILLISITCTAAQRIVPTVTASTCPSRSINYITHRLPQQCLTTSWASKPTAAPAGGNATQTVSDKISSGASAISQATNSTTSQSSALSTENLPSITTESGIAEASPAQLVESPSPAPSDAASKEIPKDGDQDADADSPLDNANFLSFEDWKRQNLAKAGQSAENFDGRDAVGGAGERRRPGMINNALDSLGEDSEIDIDFGGFVNPGRMSEAMPTHIPAGEAKREETHGPDGDAKADMAGSHKRSKDAGKTCKERSNYASFDCAATVVKTNPDCKGSTSVLVENKDSYMLNICSEKNKFFIVELCNYILIDTVVLANFEFFSSMFRTFRVSVSDSYPVKMEEWKELGTFEARNSRQIQAFLIENPLIWARFLRIELLTHYGKEYYCPVSLLRVHGTTMIEEFNHDVKGLRAEDEAEAEAEPSQTSVVETATDGTTTGRTPSSPTASSEQKTAPMAIPEVTASRSEESTAPSASSTNPPSSLPSPSAAPGSSPLLNASLNQASGHVIFRNDTDNALCVPVNLVRMPLSATKQGNEDPPPATQSQPSISSTIPSVKESLAKTDTPVSSSAVASVQTSGSPVISGSPRHHDATSSNATIPTSASSLKSPASFSQPPNPNPTTQESFFKSVHKRLQQLESNSTLSLQYIEEQSRILRDAFSKVEKRQLGKTSSFLETLNTTVLTELRDFRLQYDQIWQSTVLELSSQREQSQHEMSALTDRLKLLTEEMLFQKRVATLQFMLIIICLGFLILPRSTTGSTHFEVPPLVHNAFNRSSASLSKASHLETPPTSPPSTRPPSRYGLLRSLTPRRDPFEESRQQKSPKSPDIESSPPTPESLGSHDDPSGSSSAEGPRSPDDCSPVRRPSKFDPHQDEPVPVIQTSSEYRNATEGAQLTPKAVAPWNEESRRPSTS